LSIKARQQLRRDKSLPQLQAFHDWLVNTRVGIANGGASAKTMDYTLKRWPALIRYAETGHLPIDNNPVENGIRPIAIGKNYAQFDIMLSTYWKPAAGKAFRTADFA
jgi:hypothetical protein